MFILKTELIVAALLLGFGSAGATRCGGNRKESAPPGQNQTNARTEQSAGMEPTPAATPSKNDAAVTKGDIKVLAAGTYSGVEDLFVAIVRDAETYAALRKLVAGMPELKVEFFRTNAVAAAFLGTRNTGGYSVEITRQADGRLSFSEKAPPKGAITTEALTQPYQIISVPVSDDESVQFDLPEQSKASVRYFKVTAGEFTTGGGIAGRSEQFKFDGGIILMRHEKLATLFFDLKEVGGKGRTLNGTTTGTIEDDKRLKVPSTGAGTFVQLPRRPLVVTGSLAGKQTAITLAFESLPPRVSDGFSGSGNLEAK